MTVQTTSNLTNALRAQYLEDYINAAKMVRLYDQLAFPIGKDMSTLKKGSSVVVNFISDLAPATAAISEIADVVPVTQRDATASITPTSRYNAIQVSEKLMNTSYTPYGAERFASIGKNQMESVDLLASAQANAGDSVNRYAASRAAAEATANEYITTSVFTNAQADLETLKVPSFLDAGRGIWAAFLHPYVFADLRAATTIVAVAEYQKANIILAHELGELGPFKLVVSPWVKTFWSAGAAYASTPIATTIATSTTANIALSKTIEVAANTNFSSHYGDWVTIGTLETGDTHYSTNERVRIVSISGTTVTIIGEGANGGLRFDHAVGETVSNAHSVASVVFGGPKSLAKVYDTTTGEYGEVVGPKKQGLLDQFESLGWKFYGDYAIISESWLHRYECTFSQDA
jgi:N4-gp56 family major capsid protein